MARKALIVALVALVALAAFALTRNGDEPLGAVKGGGGKMTGSLALVMVTDANGNGTPNWGDTITWVPATDKTAYPYVNLSCYQGGTLIYYTGAGFYAGYPWPWAVNMYLDSRAWPDGTGADCVAQLVYSVRTKNVVDAEYRFTVAP